MFDTIEEYFSNLFLLPVNPKKKDWDGVFKSMAVHTRKRKPVELLLKRRPNEDDAIHQYRLDNYRPITYGSMNKALDDLYRIVSGISFTITAPDSVKDYISNTIIDNFCNSASTQNEIITTKSFIEKICLKRGIEDPNGFLIWHPSGPGVIDSSQKVQPMPKLVLSDQYVYSDSNVFIYESEEKSPLRDNDGKIVLEGRVFYFITKTDFWKMFQKGDKSDPRYETEKVYTHNLAAFPVIVLGGDMNTDGFYDSYFSPYLAFGDEAVHTFSDWQAIMTTSTFPIKEEFMNECYVYAPDKTTPADSQEENFKGGGNAKNIELVAMQKSPYNTIKRKIPLANINDDSLPVDVPSVRFIAPPIEVAKYVGEAWRELIEKAEQALNIDMTVGVDQSGKAKQLDKEAQYSMITKIGNNFFDNIYLNSLKIIDGYINRTSFEKSSCTIQKPSTFWVKNELDLIQEIATLKTQSAPQFFLAEASLDLAKKRFNGNPVSEKIFRFISIYDPYFTFTSNEKNGLLAAAVMTKEDYIRNLRMTSILNLIVEEKTATGFMDMSLEQISVAFEEKILPFMPLEPTAMTDDNGNIAA
jgi:hypothetical protein